jgi:hypothetical protein
LAWYTKLDAAGKKKVDDEWTALMTDMADADLLDAHKAKVAYGMTTA